MRLVLAIMSLSLVSCASQVKQTEPLLAAPVPFEQLPQRQMAAYPLHQYVGDIVMQMLEQSSGIVQGSKVHVINFSSVSSGQSFSEDISPQLGAQLQQSLMTYLAHSGFDVVNANFLAPNVTALQYSAAAEQNNLADFALQGTVLPQQHAYIVNSRLIDTRNNKIVAAATTEIPRNVFWSRDSVQLRNGKLYRTGQ